MAGIPLVLPGGSQAELNLEGVVLVVKRTDL